MAIPSTPQQQATGTKWPMLKFILLNGLHLFFKWSKDFGLQSPQNSKSILTTRLCGQVCLLTLSDNIQRCMSTPGLKAFFQYCELVLGGEELFEGCETELGIAMSFLGFLPAKVTSYADCFSHCVFFLSLGTNTGFLYQKEGCSCLQTWGRESLPLLSLLYPFVSFVACFLR